MQTIMTRKFLQTAVLAFPMLIAAGRASADAVAVNLTVQHMNATLSDGNTAKMWGYCLTDASTCTSGAAWAPGPTITVPYVSGGTNSLTITLTNTLKVPTSIVILGQQGGGLGAPVKIPSPDHSHAQPLSWPAAGGPGDPVFNPPTQIDRARSFAPEATIGTPQTYTWSNLQPGTYIYETGSHPSLQVPMGLYGVVVVTTAPTNPASPTTPPTITAVGQAYPGIAYDADATLLFSEIDAVQNKAVDIAESTGTNESLLWNDPSCGTACYPPAVNYSPLYFLINGQPFDSTAPQRSAFLTSGSAATTGGKVLVRMLNAGLRTHVPSIVGLPMSLVAEDGNVSPGTPKLQTEVLLPAGKTIDVTVAPKQTVSGTYDLASYPVFDRQLSLSTGNIPNGGMQGFLAVAPAGTTQSTLSPAALPAAVAVAAIPDSFVVPYNGTSFSGNVLSNDIGIVNVAVAPAVAGLTFNANGTFTYSFAPATTIAPAGFTYCDTAAHCAAVSFTVGPNAGVPQAVPDTFVSNIATTLKISSPGVLANDTDASGTQIVGDLKAVLDTTSSGLNVVLNKDGSFTATLASVPTGALATTFTYHVTNAQGTASAPVTVTLNFDKPTGLAVTLLDSQEGKAASTGTDYLWTLEEDTTFFHDPKDPSSSLTGGQSLATNFHSSYMPVVATGCTGPKSCGDNNSLNGAPLTSAQVKPRTFPGDVLLNPAKRYYLSILPGDAADGDGHTIGAAPIAPGQTAVTVLLPKNPLPPAQISVIVFEDNNPTNGDVDDSEQGLGGFTINLFDTRGSSGDPAGQMTYDLSGMPFSNSLAHSLATVGTGAAAHKVDQCPISVPMGVVVTCPEKDSDGNDSPLAGMALIKNVNPGRYDVTASPGGVHAAENWVQVSTLEGTRNNDTFVKAGEPAYWQEFGPPGFHSFIGFVNPDHIKADNNRQCGTRRNPAPCTNTITGRIPSLHMDRPTPYMANLNNSCGNPTDPNDPSCRATLSATTCYVGLNTVAGTGPDVSMATCDEFGNFTLTGVPSGTHTLVIWDQWLDQIIAYKAVTVPTGAGQNVPVGDIPVFSWFTRVEQSAFVDLNKNGIRDANEPGVSQIPMNIRFRDGSISNYLTTDSSGGVTANELFPLFNWYVLESDTTRYKGTGINVTYDAGGKPDATGPYAGVLNSKETVSLPTALQVPGAKYTAGSTNRIDPGTILTEGTQGYINQTAKLDWGKTPYDIGETGGITGMVYYASTRGFDDPTLEVQFSWEPAVPRVPVSLYKETTNPDGSTSLTQVDKTTTWSWDDTASSVHCPGDPYDPTAPNDLTKSDPYISYTVGASSQYKCYDGQHSFNQIQPAVYDGRYRFPSAACDVSACKTQTITNPDGSTVAQKILLPGKYIVELTLPQGYEIVKEEDKNILIGDTWLDSGISAQFQGVGNIFILPDQATLNDVTRPGFGLAYPPCAGDLHRVPDYLVLFPDSGQIAPYAGQDRPLCTRKEVTLSDQMQASADFQVFTPAPIAAHFSGIMLNDAAAEFDPTNPSFLEKASLPNAPVSIRDYNGVEILRVYNDKWGTFNGLAPSTWEANVPNPSGYAPNMLTSCMNDPGPILDTRPTLADGMTPNPTYNKMIVDPAYNPMFSNFCYVWPYMAGITTYLDTPVLPVSAYASASTYEPVDCAYPDATPAISRVDGSDGAGVGPWVSATGANHRLTIKALGEVSVLNAAYTGPTASNAPFNAPKVTRHYGFGTSAGSVTINGTPATIITWSDTQITVSVASGTTTGELSITTAKGKKSVDTVTVTIGGKAPTIVHPVDPNTSTANGLAHPIQDAIDAAAPGDLIMLEAGSYPELVIMWKPVRLQGVGAASVIINATKYPNQKMADWRAKINSLFGIDADGNISPEPGGGPPGNGSPQVDALPGQEITGGIVRLEPSALSTEEGPGIAVLAKGYKAGGTTPLNANGDCTPPTATRPSPNYSVSNFLCAVSRIDGVSVTGGDSGGGIYVNGWAHNIEIANNRVYGNAGPFNGGVRVGQPYLEGETLPGGGNFPGFGYDKNVNIHHNAITNNGTVEGNAAAGTTGTGGAGGGVSICSGTDNYKLRYNFICGNYSSSDGGGVGHLGLSQNGTIAYNQIIFNESYNQTGSQHGGGLVIEGEGGTATTLTIGTGNVTVDSNLIQGNFARAGSGGGVRLQNVNGEDAGSRQQRWQITLTNNMIVDNMAAWAGGGVALADTLYSSIINNTIAANDSTGIAASVFNTTVGGASTGPTTGVPSPAGISSELTSAPLLQAAGADYSISSPALRNNIVWQNRSFFFDMSSKSSGATSKPSLIASNQWSDAIGHLGSPLGAQTKTGECVAGAKYWDMGVVGDPAPLAQASTTTLTITAASQATTGGGPFAVRTVTITTSAPHGLSTGQSVTIAGFTGNNSNRYNGQFIVTVTGASTFTYSPSNNGSGNLPGHDASLWQVTATHPVLTATYSVFTDTLAHPGTGNQVVAAYVGVPGSATGLNLTSVYCNGSRVIPGVQFEPGTPFQPSFAIDVAATLDESGNYVDLHFGPLSLTDPAVAVNAPFVGDYHIASPAGAAYNGGTNGGAPDHDFDAQVRLRTAANPADIGADEFVGDQSAALSVTATNIAFGNHLVGTSTTLTATLSNTGNAVANITYSALANFTRATGGGNCGATLAAGANCTLSITFAPPRAQVTLTAAYADTLTLTVAQPAAPASLTLGLTGTGFRLFNPAALDFGNQAPNTTSAAQSVTLFNQGTTALSITNIVLANSGGGGGGAGQFTGLNFSNCGATAPFALAAGASCTVSVQFRPISNGAKTANLNFTVTGVGGGGGGGALPVSLSGTGLAPIAVVAFSGPAPALTTAPANTANKSGTITVTNTGSGALVISSAAVSGGGGRFTKGTDGCTGASVAPGGTCSVVVNYAPGGSTTQRAGTLTLTDTGAVNGIQSTNFQGD